MGLTGLWVFILLGSLVYLTSVVVVGQYAGYLGSGYFIGNFIGSFWWGWVSDRLGRRPVLLLGVITTITCELLFGFSQNFVWAIMARFLWGMLNGNIGVVKTYISEVTTSAYNRVATISANSCCVPADK